MHHPVLYMSFEGDEKCGHNGDKVNGQNPKLRQEISARLPSIRRHKICHEDFVPIFYMWHSNRFLPRNAILCAVYAVIVCLSMCLSNSGIVSKRLNVGSCE